MPLNAIRVVRRVFAVVVTMAMCGAMLVTVPASAASSSDPSLTTVANALSSAGADAGASPSWSSSSSAPVTISNNGLTVTLPVASSGSVTLSDNGQSLSIGLPLASPSSTGNNIGDATTAYAGTPDVTVVAQGDTAGSRQAVVITGPNAPATYSYPLTLPAGASLVDNADGSYSIVEQTSGAQVFLGSIAPAWAKDASGQSVPTSYSLQGTTLTQSVDFTAATTFPVVADPYITWGWGPYFNLSGSEIKQFFPDFQAWENAGILGLLVCTAVGVLTAQYGLAMSTIMSFLCGGLFVVSSIVWPGATPEQVTTELKNIDTSACYQYYIPALRPLLYNSSGFPASWTKVPSSNCAGEY